MNAKIFLLALPLSLLFGSCTDQSTKADAYGNFEADEIRIAAQVAGPILNLSVAEGQILQKGQAVALIDSTAMHLQKQQLLSSIQALKSKLRDPMPEVKVLEKQKEVLLKERQRLEKLIEGKAATQKQLDDLDGQLAILEQKVQAARATARQANRAILSEEAPLRAKLASLEDQLRRCRVVNPSEGQVLSKLAAEGELAAPGKPLYVLAPTDTLILRAYFGATQLPEIQEGMKVEVRIDAPDGNYYKYPGIITWISPKAEFTPKVIQTKEERVNLVYAVKIAVPNDGKLKIGMPAEVHLPDSKTEKSK